MTMNLSQDEAASVDKAYAAWADTHEECQRLTITLKSLAIEEAGLRKQLELAERALKRAATALDIAQRFGT